MSTHEYNPQYNPLNFHRSFNENRAVAWLNNETELAYGMEMVPTVPLFEFDKSIPMREILEDSTLASVRMRGRGLYARLAELPLRERRSEVERLNELLRTRTRKQSGY